MLKRGIIIELIIVFIIVFVSTGIISAGTLKVTNEHPFLINGKWIDAKDLVVGDMIMTLDGKLAQISGIKDVLLKEAFKVYNLEASVFHDFVVSEDNLIVHNSNRYVPRIDPGEVYPLSTEQKIALSQVILNKQLTEIEKNAIRNIETNYPGTGNTNLKTKIKILEEAGFTKLQREKLIRSGVCGKLKCGCSGDEVSESVKTTFYNDVAVDLDIVKRYKVGGSVSKFEYEQARNNILFHPYFNELSTKLARKNYPKYTSEDYFSEIFMILERWDGEDDLLCYVTDGLDSYMKAETKKFFDDRFCTFSFNKLVDNAGEDKIGIVAHNIQPGKHNVLEEIILKTEIDANSPGVVKLMKSLGDSLDGWTIERKYTLKNFFNSEVVIFKNKDGRVAYALIKGKQISKSYDGDWLFFDDINDVIAYRKNGVYKYSILKGDANIRNVGHRSVLYNTRLKKIAIKVNEGGKSGRGSGELCEYVEKDIIIHDKAKGLVLFEHNGEIRFYRPGDPQHVGFDNINRYKGLGNIFYDKEKNLLIEFNVQSYSPLKYTVKSPVEPDFYTDMLGKRVLVIKRETGFTQVYFEDGNTLKAYQDLRSVQKKLFSVLYNPKNGRVSEFYIGHVDKQTTNIFKLSDKGGFYDPEKNMIFYFEEGKWYQTWPQEHLLRKPRNMEGRTYRRVYDGESGLEFFDECGVKWEWKPIYEDFVKG
ncbi:hypothetical protein GOV12_06430 [Candidatus Pacearchaeota archaeon]|nr:hypothetical protein [Candidatus Pacearchaeota archaeon]